MLEVCLIFHVYPFILKSDATIQRLCDSLCELHVESFSLRHSSFFIEDCYKFLFWVGMGWHEGKRTLAGRMEGPHGGGKWLVVAYTGFQIISFSCASSHSHPLSYKESQVLPSSARSVGSFPRISSLWTILPYFIITLPSFFWLLDLFGSPTFAGPFAFKKMLWIYVIFNLLTLILVGLIERQPTCVVSQKSQYCFLHL